jgi:general secretion pathway protein C
MKGACFPLVIKSLNSWIAVDRGTDKVLYSQSQPSTWYPTFHEIFALSAGGIRPWEVYPHAMLLKKYFWLIFLVLTTILVWALVNLILTIISSRLEVPLDKSIPVAYSKAQKTAEIPPLNTYDPIIYNNIFNPGVQPQKSLTAKETAEKDSSKGIAAAQVNFVLKGVAVGMTPEASFAVIYDEKAKKQGLYRTGDKIGDATIGAIEADRVILKRNGRREALLMMRERNDSKGFSASHIRSTKQDGSLVRQTDGETYVLDRERVNDLISNVNQFMTQLRVRPFFVNGAPIGYLVTDIKQGSLIDQIGLKDGDVIQGVNGIPITKPEQAFAAYQQLKNESQITLEVRRGNSSQVITYELK